MPDTQSGNPTPPEGEIDWRGIAQEYSDRLTRWENRLTEAREFLNEAIIDGGLSPDLTHRIKTYLDEPR